MARRVILDTGVLIAIERGRLDVDAVLGVDDAAIAAITAMELLVGVERADGLASKKGLSTSVRTPVSWSKSALASVVSRIRLVAAAVAAIIMSFADLGRPAAIAATARRACTRAMPTL